jgi:glycosyltransferase involved in cell wall biosynthesis
MKNAITRYEASVIIPTYNRSQLLGYSLDSLCGQDLDKDRFEVIVADDGSSDDTRKMIKKYRDRLNLKYFFQEDKGYRVASARNMGIRGAEGEICIFIDSGVILNVDCVARHIAFHKEKGPLTAAIGYLFGFDRTPESVVEMKKLVDPADPAGSIRRLAGNEMFFDVREGQYTPYQDRIHELPAPWYFFWTGHLSVGTMALLEVGLFDEQYDGKWGGEDNDLGLRLHLHGVGIYLLRAAEGIHYPHDKDKEERRIDGYQNCLYFHNKFQLPETRLFLETYMISDEYVDLNKLIRQLALA